jgi:hypothetical protein
LTLLVDNPARCCEILKYIFYVNSYVNKLFGKRNRVGWFITLGVIVRRDDRRGTTVKGNDGGEWNSDSVVLWLGTR